MASGLFIEIAVRGAMLALIGSGIVGWTRFRNRWKAKASKDWPETKATVHSGTVLPVPQSSMFTAKLSYSYFVEEYRSGTYERIFSKETAADTFVKRLKDRKVDVRYSPKNADKSVLDEASIKEAEMIPIPE